MTITQTPDIPHYTPAPATQENLEWAELATVDLSKARTPEGRKGLVGQVHDAIKNEGFLYVVNHGLTPEQTSRMFDLANYAIEKTEIYGKNAGGRDLSRIQTSEILGKGLFHVAGGVRDEIEQYNMNFREMSNGNHPEPLKPFLPEIDAFTKYAHFNIFNALLRIIALTLELDEEYFVKMHDHSSLTSIIALTLELDEEYFVKMHDHSAETETFLRFVKYYPRSEEDEEQSQKTWLKGHKDFHALTLLFSQPISALQIMTTDGKWKWVKHIDNAIVVNIGESIEFFSGGYYSSTIHRVRQPPDDQRNQPRVGVIYFVAPHDDVELGPITESPIVRRMDLSKLRFVGGKIPSMKAYRMGRVMNYGGLQATRPGKQEGVDEEELGGVVVQHYN